MKPNTTNITKWVFLFLMAPELAFAGECSRFVNDSKQFRGIPPLGLIYKTATAGDRLDCGTSITTDHASMVLKSKSGVEVRIAAQSFVEWESAEKIKLYRGKIFVRGPVRNQEVVIETPNARVQSLGGALLVEYLPDQQKSSLSSLNRRQLLVNRFNEGFPVQVSTGFFSQVAYRSERVTPTPPELIADESLLSVVRGLEFQDQEILAFHEAILSIAKKSRKSTIQDLESWRSLEREREAGRSLASATVTPKFNRASNSALEQENQKVLEDLGRRLWGDYRITDPGLSKESDKEPNRELKKAKRIPASVGHSPLRARRIESVQLPQASQRARQDLIRKLETLSAEENFE